MTLNLEHSNLGLHSKMPQYFMIQIQHNQFSSEKLLRGVNPVNKISTNLAFPVPITPSKLDSVSAKLCFDQQSAHMFSFTIVTH